MIWKDNRIENGGKDYDKRYDERFNAQTDSRIRLPDVSGYAVSAVLQYDGYDYHRKISRCGSAGGGWLDQFAEFYGNRILHRRMQRFCDSGGADVWGKAGIRAEAICC